MLARPEIEFDSPEAMEASYGGYLSIPNLTATHGTESRLFASETNGLSFASFAQNLPW